MVLFLVHEIVVGLAFGFEWFDITIVLFDVAHDLKLCCSVERMSCPSEQLHQMCSDVTSTKIHSLRCVGNRVTFIDRTCVSNAITTVKHNTSSKSSCIQRQYRLCLEKQIWDSESLEKNLRHLDPVCYWIVRRFGQQHSVFSWVHLEFIKDMSPNSFHLFPVLDNSMLNGVIKFDDPLILLCLLSNKVLVLFQCVYHDSLMFWLANTTINFGELFLPSKLTKN